ncbi:MAG: hypothetical protein KAI66_03225 [Lentisphaeria bacterium]|nr:hypothetical protein [Lentisphaeria bacterium]
MADHIDTGLVMATELEALPLISGGGFARVGTAPFPVYVKDAAVLVLSGVGKSNAAAATAWLICQYKPRRVCNAGASGATGDALELGQVFQIGEICEPDRPRLRCAGSDPLRADPIADLPTARLATQDHVVMDEERRRIESKADLVDMEGAAVVQTCRSFGVPVHLVKYVSDVHDGHNISDSIVLLRDAFCCQLRDQILA